MYRAIAKNKRNTVFIILLFIVIIGGLGWLAGAVYGSWAITIWTLAIATIYAVVQYFAASRLAISISGGQEIQKADNPRLYRIVENIAITGTLSAGAYVFLVNSFATPNASDPFTLRVLFNGHTQVVTGTLAPQQNSSNVTVQVPPGG